MLIGVEDTEEWQERSSPVFAAARRALAPKRLDGLVVALGGVLSANTVPLALAIRASGADLVLAPSHAAPEAAPIVDQLFAAGIKVLWQPSMTEADLTGVAATVARMRPDLVLSSGASILIHCHLEGHWPRAALEGTRTGVNRLQGMALGCPVFDWDSSPLKSGIELRFHVAEAFWAAFAYLTGLSLFGRTVLVLGFGAVGKGIAERARHIGARTLVFEPDLLRACEAMLHGHESVSFEEGLMQADIVITATGRDGALGPSHLARLRDGTILANAGHAQTEVSWPLFAQRGVRSVRANIAAVKLDHTREVIVLCEGLTLNLSTGAGPFGNDLWDPFNALILRGLHWLNDGMLDDTPFGLQPFPPAIQEQVARDLLKSRETDRSVAVAARPALEH
jgi:adenosylhomocysteinase